MSKYILSSRLLEPVLQQTAPRKHGNNYTARMKKEKLLFLKYRAVAASLLEGVIPLSETVFDLGHEAGNGKERNA